MKAAALVSQGIAAYLAVLLVGSFFALPAGSYKGNAWPPFVVLMCSVITVVAIVRPFGAVGRWLAIALNSAFVVFCFIVLIVLTFSSPIPSLPISRREGVLVPLAFALPYCLSILALRRQLSIAQLKGPQHEVQRDLVNRAALHPREVARVLRDVSGSRFRYVMTAWLIATVPTIMLMPLLYAAKARFHLQLPGVEMNYGFAIAALIGAPLIETGLMLFTYYALGLLIWRSRVLRSLVLAALAASAHLISGGWLHVAGVLWLFVVLSLALSAWTERRARDAFIVVTSIHFLHNVVVLALVGLLAHYAA